VKTSFKLDDQDGSSASHAIANLIACANSLDVKDTNACTTVKSIYDCINNRFDGDFDEVVNHWNDYVRNGMQAISVGNPQPSLL
jgi:DICT domain-containing protein